MQPEQRMERKNCQKAETGRSWRVKGIKEKKPKIRKDMGRQSFVCPELPLQMMLL